MNEYHILYSGPVKIKNLLEKRLKDILGSWKNISLGTIKK